MELKKDDRISIYGNLNIQTISKKIQKDICIAFENKKICLLGDYLYDFLEKEYEKIDYNWMDNNKKLKTTKLIINNKLINPNSCVSFSGYVEDNTGIPSQKGNKYKFEIIKISIEDIFNYLENLYDEYICEFDTIKSGLKIRLQKIKIE